MLRNRSIDSFHHSSFSTDFARAAFPAENCRRWKAPARRDEAGDGVTVVVEEEVEQSVYRRREAEDLEKRAMVGFRVLGDSGV